MLLVGPCGAPGGGTSAVPWEGSSRCSQPGGGGWGGNSWEWGLGQPLSCGAHSQCPDHKALHRALPIACPISFMAGGYCEGAVDLVLPL